MSVRVLVVGAVLYALAHAGCGPAQKPTTSRMQAVPQPKPPSPARPVITDPEGCPSIDAASLANARPMTLENPDQLVHGHGRVILHTSYPDRSTSSGFENLTLGRFDPLSEAAAAAAERVEQRGSDIEVWLDAADGTSRQAHVDQGQNSHNETQYYTIRAVIHPTTHAIRLMSKDGLIERLERVQMPPAVEAVVLRDRPPLIAVRVRGVSSPIRLELREDLKGEPMAMAYANEEIHVNGRGAYPCWLVIPDAEGVEGDQGAALRLTLFDVFHLWRFYHAR